MGNIVRVTIVVATITVVLTVSFVFGLNISLRLFGNYSFAYTLISFVIVTPIIGVFIMFGAYKLFLEKHIPKIGKIPDGNIIFGIAVLLLLIAAYLFSIGVL